MGVAERERPLLLTPATSQCCTDLIKNPNFSGFFDIRTRKPLSYLCFCMHILLTHPNPPATLVNSSRSRAQLPCSIDQSFRHHSIHSLRPLARLLGSCDFPPPSLWILTFREWGPANEMLIQALPLFERCHGMAMRRQDEWRALALCYSVLFARCSPSMSTHLPLSPTSFFNMGFAFKCLTAAS